MHLTHYLIPNWPAPSNVKAYSTYRFGGKSQGIFESFNLSMRGNDPDMPANRRQLCEELQLSSEPVWLNQQHTNRVIRAEEMKNNLIADAAYTHRPNTICIVGTADCLPVLFCNRQGTVVAAAHAGWRGLAAGVIENTVRAMGIPANTLYIWLGPAIGPTAFEVGEDVRQVFTQQDRQAIMAFQPAKQTGKWLANLVLLAQQRLAGCGISKSQIFGGDRCTYSEPDYFFSYRRDQGKTGGMASLIWFMSRTTNTV